MSNKYTYADVIIDPNDPRVEIGKEYYCSCYPSGGLNLANMGIGFQQLVRVDKDSSFGPFVLAKKDDGVESFPCIIRKKEYTEDDIITDVLDPRLKDAIGKTVYVAHKLYGSVVDNANNNDSANKGVLVNLGYDPSHPFEVHTELGLHWDRIILSKNQPPRKKYVPLDLNDREDVFNLMGSWLMNKTSGSYHCVITIKPAKNLVYIDGFGEIGPQELLEDFIFVFNDSPCGKLVEEE